MPLRASSHPGSPNSPSCSALAWYSCWPGLSPWGESWKRTRVARTAALTRYRYATQPTDDAIDEMICFIHWMYVIRLKCKRMAPHSFLTFSWWRHQMETFSALLVLCAGNSPATGELITQRPVTRRFDDFFDLRLNKRLSKQSWGWWFETPSRPLWRRWLSDAIWRHRSGSTLAQVMACCLSAPSSYLNQCWLIIKYGPVAITQELFYNKYLSHQFLKWDWNALIKISLKYPRGQWVKLLNGR